MAHKKYDVTVSMNQGGSVKTRTIEVHANNEDDARSAARSFAGPLWEVDKVEELGETRGGGKPYVAGTD